MDNIQVLFDALGLPSAALIDMRVPKKVLVEQIAPTTADKRVIQDGIDELQWRATCKAATVGVPAFSSDDREYLEIAILTCAFRAGAKTSRLIELIHRGIPYPVLLISSEATGSTLSAAHKRHAQNEAGKVVVERIVAAALPGIQNPHLRSLLERIPLAMQPKRDLFSLYEGWLTCLEALNAAQLSGSFSVPTDDAAIHHRRDTLDLHIRLTREIAGLRARASREKQLNRKVELNLQIQRLEAELAAQTIGL
jgi:hypothetical protein